MPDKSEAARIEAEVQKRLASIMAEQQQQWAAAMEAMMKNSLGGIDQANAALAREQKKLELELDRAQELRRKAESEGEKMATEAYEKHRAQYDESAKIKVLRDLTRQHIEAGKPNSEIMAWLGVEEDFVDKFYKENRTQRAVPAGSPKIRFQDYGRGGTVYYESEESNFQMWWEMGFNALAIVDVPTPDNWVSRTGLPIERRAEILNFIGEEIVAQQTIRGGSFIVGENVLTIYSD